jgi:hypothetical protein
MKGVEEMTLFRPLDLETDAAELARLHNYTLPEPVTAETVREWWEPRKDEIRATTLALNKQGRPIGFWDIDRETWMRPGHWWLKAILLARRAGMRHPHRQ